MNKIINKKVLIAIFFATLMLAGVASFAGQSTQSTAVQNTAQVNAAQTPLLANIPYKDVGNLSNVYQTTMVKLINNGTDVGYLNLSTYLGGYNYNNVSFSSTTFVNESGDTVDFHTLGNYSKEWLLGTYMYNSINTCIAYVSMDSTHNANYNVNYNVSGTSVSSTSLNIWIEKSGNVSYLVFDSIDNGYFRFNLSSPVYVSPNIPHQLYSNEEIIGNSNGGITYASYNSYYNLIYLPSQFSGILHILNGTNYNLVDNVTSNMNATFSALYNPYNHYEYVATIWAGLTIFNGTKVLASGLNVSQDPIGVIYDPVNHFVYVTSNSDDGLWIYNGTSYVESISYKSYGNAHSTIYDSNNNMIYSTYYNSSTNFGIVQINPSTNSIVKYIQTKYFLNFMAFDSANNEIYAETNAYTQHTDSIGNASAITTMLADYNTNFNLIKNITNIMMPMGGIIVHNKDLYVEGDDSSIFVISPQNTLVYIYKHLNPDNHIMGLTYDNKTGKLIVSAMGDDANGYTTVPTKLIALEPFSDLTVKVNGIPKTASWAFSVDNVLYSVTGNTYNVSMFADTYNLSVPDYGYMYPVYSHIVNVNGTLNEIINYELMNIKSSNNNMILGYYFNNSMSEGNFTYKGYNFSEEIYNQTSISIGTNSTHAPNVTLSFKVSSGLYDVVMKSGNTTTVLNTTSPVNGYINVTYNPAKMPLDPVFSLSQVTDIIPAPPSPRGGFIFIIENTPIRVILMWAGIIAILAIGLLYIDKKRNMKKGK